MKRWLVRICVFLLLGAIVNVAVAWGLVLNPLRVPQRGGTICLAAEIDWWEAAAPRGMSTPTRAGRLVIPGVEQDLLMGESRPAADLRPNESTLEEAISVQAGFPLRSLRGTRFNYVSPTDNKTAYELVAIIAPPRPLVAKKIEYQRPMWPLRPLCPGFAINTVFYAVVLWLLFAGPFVLRRRWRIRRGLCPKCAYDLRGTRGGAEATACPECGAKPF